MSFQPLSNKPHLFLFVTRNRRQVGPFFVVIRDERNKVQVFFKNSSGTTISNQLRNQLIRFYGKGTTTFFNHPKVDSDRSDYGPFCLRNLKIFLDKYPLDENSFLGINFASNNEVQKDKLKVLKEFVFEVPKNEKFKNKYKLLIESFPMELSSAGEEYFNILKDQLDRDENDFDEKLVKEYKEKFLDVTIIEKFVNSNSSRSNNGELNIELEFPEETSKISIVWKMLCQLKRGFSFHGILKLTSEELGIDYDQLEKYYEACVVKEESRVKKETTQEVDIEQIIRNLPDKVDNTENGSISLQELLNQIRLQADEPLTCQQRTDFETKYRKYERCYEDINAEEDTSLSLDSISQWAKNIKGRLGNDDEHICKALAKMAKVIYEVSGGKCLRNTQVMAVLIFMLDKNSKGRLCQIETGEGKTMVVALLGAMLALQGETVDIITSNPILADEAIKQMDTFYKILNLNVAILSSGIDTKIAYDADIVYGTITNFEFDHLNDLMDNVKIRGNRGFISVILDEVDSMLIDDCSNIAKVGQTFSGMESLRYVYTRIWQELQNAENKFKEKISRKLEELKQQEDSQGVIEECEKELAEMMKNCEEMFKKEIANSNLIPFEVIPPHLKNYTEKKLSIWINNAIYAKYNCYEYCQYRIEKDHDSGQNLVVPIDYQNTGVTLRNTLWTDGLHQFIQLKHNLYVTSESVTSRFISNFGYILKYKRIFGLTGTLGSNSEQKLLSHVYHVDYAKIPPFKPKKLKVLPMLIKPDLDWMNGLIDSVQKIYINRAVLVICETELDLQYLKDVFTGKQITVKEYANENHITTTEEQVNVGDVILATNIAGRGTDFKISPSVNEAGGLHVCVGFLPCNQRVEDQAFGRTSRQGNDGTAQLVIKASEVEHLQKINDNNVKTARDKLEEERLEHVKNNVVKVLGLKDELFSCFATLYVNLSKKFTEEEMFILDDLEEHWAFWLEEITLKTENLTTTKPQQQFAEFEKSAEDIISGTVKQNPYNYMKMGQYLYDNYNEKDKAKKMLQNALDMSNFKTPGLLYSVHLKLFEIVMNEGGVLMKRITGLMKKLVFLSSCEDNSNYKMEAPKHLENALDSIKTETNYLEKLLPQIGSILTTSDNNLFCNQLRSRLTCLKLHETNINKLTTLLKAPQEFYINSKSPMTLTTIEVLVKNEDQFLEAELNELRSIGLQVLYTIQEVHPVDNIVIKGAQIQITSGFAVFAAALLFPPIFPLISPLGATLISEGIIDVVLEVMKLGLSPFNKKEYIKSKIITYGISVVTLGVKAVLQCANVLKKAIAYCRKLSASLKASPLFPDLCIAVSENLKTIARWFELALTRAEHLTKNSNLTRSNLLVNKTLPSIGAKIFQSFINRDGKKIIFDLFKGNMVKTLTNNQAFMKKLTEKVMAALAKILPDKVPQAEMEKIVADELKRFLGREVEDILSNEDYQFTLHDYKDILRKIFSGVVNSLGITNAALKEAKRLIGLLDDKNITNFAEYSKIFIDLRVKHGDDINSIIIELCGKIIKDLFNISIDTYTNAEN